LRVLEP